MNNFNIDFIRPVTALLNANKVTKAERAVIYGVAQGLSNQEVADELDLSEKTIKFHLGNIYKKLSVKNKTNLVIKMAKLGHYGKQTFEEMQSMELNPVVKLESMPSQLPGLE